MIVYSDFECPFCGRFAREILPELERRYVATGEVAFVFHHLPLAFHPLATQAAVSAECAGQQGRFWEAHDLLFSFDRLDEGVIRSVPQEIGIDEERFADCASDGATASRVSASVDEAVRLGVIGTPTFFVGKRLESGRIHVSEAFAGAMPVENFAERLDALL